MRSRRFSPLGAIGSQPRDLGFGGARDQAEGIEIREIRPAVETREDGKWLTIPDDQGYPVTEQLLSTADRGGGKGK